MNTDTVRRRSAVLGPYNLTADEAMANLDGAAGYRPFVASIPEAANTTLPALASYAPRVTIPANSMIWALSGCSAQAAGFSVQITDTATRKPLFSQPATFTGPTVLNYKNCYGQNQTAQLNLQVFPKPFLVLAPGLLSVQLVNLAAVANAMQLCIHFALPGPTSNPNDHNAAINADVQLAKAAIRDAGSSIVSAAYGPDAAGGSSTPPPPEDTQTAAFEISTAGDNVVIPGSLGRIYIYQIDIWNTGAQTIRFLNGTTPLRGALLNFPASMGYGLPNVEESGKPHWKCSPGNAFVINIDGPSTVTGFIRYRME